MVLEFRSLVNTKILFWKGGDELFLLVAAQLVLLKSY